MTDETLPQHGMAMPPAGAVVRRVTTITEMLITSEWMEAQGCVYRPGMRAWVDTNGNPWREQVGNWVEADRDVQILVSGLPKDADEVVERGMYP